MKIDWDKPLNYDQIMELFDFVDMELEIVNSQGLHFIGFHCYLGMKDDAVFTAYADSFDKLPEFRADEYVKLGNLKPSKITIQWPESEEVEEYFRDCS